MINHIKNESNFLSELGVTNEAIELLVSNTDSVEIIRKDLRRLELIYKDVPWNIYELPQEFKTYLWTLLGEISIPNNLGEDVPNCWPILLFPFAQDHEEEMVKSYLLEYGYMIKKTEMITFNEILHACLYGGQPWFNSLRYALNNEVSVWGKKAKVLWMFKGPEYKCSIAAMARKLQLQLRPNMTSYNVKSKDLLYPGVLKAFHTPNLGNVGIHTLILGLEELKC